MRRLALLGLLVAGLLVVVAPPVAADSVPSQREVLRLVNVARGESRICGTDLALATHPVKWDKRLGRLARKHAGDMAARRDIGHWRFRERLRAVGFRFRWAGENVGAGQRTERDIVAGWLRSPGHCRVLMSPHARRGGVGLAFDVSGRPYWSLDLGRLR